MYSRKITPGGGRAGTDDPGSIGMGEWVYVFSPYSEIEQVQVVASVSVPPRLPPLPETRPALALLLPPGSFLRPGSKSLSEELNPFLPCRLYQGVVSFRDDPGPGATHDMEPSSPI